MLLKALVLRFSAKNEFEIAVALDVFVGHDLPPGRLHHQAGAEVDPRAHGGVLAALLTPDHARKGRAGGDTDAIAGAGQVGQIAQVVLHRSDEFQGALRIIFKRNGGAEQAEHDATLVAKINFFQIPAEIIDLFQHGGGKMVEGRVGIHAGKRQEHADHVAEFTVIVFRKYFLRQKVSHNGGVGCRQVYRIIFDVPGIAEVARGNAPRQRLPDAQVPVAQVFGGQAQRV